ncbi:type I-E CRISPR-associated protein Cas7/Cse4/CasC [Streptomyces sp. N35]|uniref:type I-E CRISPR-associated protein Cas7/Cse4/CasC n=1 Tax=Streptomyces sp. N35 TaxID=2795730 RepID=UPI0018F45A1A|nr:type I-E CRISPR-associated protein Cas7/Cse4/CasC [Streptomyces sp. N35]
MNPTLTLDDPRYLNLHSLTCYNGVLLVRDANGRPKQMPFGNALRDSLSPQTQRRAARTYMRDQANEGTGALAGYAFGIRTREWALLTGKELAARGWNAEQALAMAKHALMSLGIVFGTKDNTANLTKVLIFAAQNAHETMADVIERHREVLEPWLTDVQKVLAAKTKAKDKKTAAEDTSAEPDAKIPALPAAAARELLAALSPADAIDIALYGRFLAGLPADDVDGAVQTMTAITVGRAAGVEDFYSAADDMKLLRKATPRQAGTHALDLFEPSADNGAGMTGYQNLISGTFYAHSVLDRHKLRTSLAAHAGDTFDVEAAAQAAEAAFIDAFCHAVPSAKRNTSAAPGVLPKFVLVHADKRQHNYVGAFEKAIEERTSQDGTQAASLQAAERLLDHHALIIRKRGIDPGTALTYDLDIADLLQQRRDAGRLQPTEVDTPDQLAHPTTAIGEQLLAGQPT